jgi:hypothetical protein
MRKTTRFLKRTLAFVMAGVVSFGACPLNTQADTQQTGDAANEQATYVLMNIPYDDFYKAEVTNEVKVDAFSSATKRKTTGNLAAGSYHVSKDGSDITGITYPVKVDSSVDLSKYTEVTDTTTVTISGTEYTGSDALFENASYSYYKLTDTPSYYKELTVADGGDLQFGKAVGDVTKKTSVKATFLTKSDYGDYQLNLDATDLGLVGDEIVKGVVISTKEKHDYGLRHIENIWKNVELAWCTGFTNKVHNCDTSSAHYESMMGETINKVTYYTDKGIYEVSFGDVTIDGVKSDSSSGEIYVPKKFDYTLSVEDASVSAGTTTVTLTGLPDDYNAVYSVKDSSGNDLSGASVDALKGTLTFATSGVKNGKYTLTVTDSGNVYAPISTDFVLYTDTIPVRYDETNKKLVAADEATDEEVSNYIANISSVSVNGKSYATSGKGATTIINKDGTLNTDADPILDAGEYTLVISATGYKGTDVSFEYVPAFRYVYAALSWAEYWAGEDVYAAGDVAASTELDSRDESDKGAFDAVSRATTNHGLHRGSYQCTAEITLKDGTKLDVAYYTGQTEGVLTNGETFSYAKDDIASYVVTGIKYVPVKVAVADYDAFKAKYSVVENGGTLSGGYSEENLTNYTDVVAKVTSKTNGLKTATKNTDGSFSFSARVSDGSASGLRDANIKTASSKIVTEVKKADGTYGEFLRVDLTGDYGDLAANMQAVKWTYYGQDATYTKALQSYGTKFAADNWMHKKMGIQLGLTDSLRCKLPEGTDGTGYWTITVYALGYQDYTVKFQAKDENIKAENIVKSKNDSSEPTATETPTVTPTPSATQEPAPAPSSTTTQPEKTSVKVGSTYTIGKLKYKVTLTKSSSRTVTVISPKNKKVTSVSIPATVKIQNQAYKVTAVADKAFANCKKLKKVVVGKNVTSLGKNVFSGDSKLKAITIQSKKLNKVGSGALKGINKKAKIKVPSAKLKNYKKLLKGKGQGSKVKIVK